MASPRFVVKRIGNDYKILRADAQAVALSALPLAGGGILALKGLFRGGDGIYRGSTGGGEKPGATAKGCATTQSSGPGLGMLAGLFGLIGLRRRRRS